MRVCSRSGFTLLEMCISFALLLTVLGMVGMFQVSNGGLLATTSTRGLLHESSSHALEGAASELRWAEATSLVVSALNGSSRLDFRTPVGYAAGNPLWSTIITYQVEAAPADWDGDGAVNEGRLVRIQNARKTVLCDYVIPGGFTAALGGTNLVLRLRASKQDRQTKRILTADEQTSISLRN
jgi:hypothetical protein